MVVRRRCPMTTIGVWSGGLCGRCCGDLWVYILARMPGSDAMDGWCERRTKTTRAARKAAVSSAATSVTAMSEEVASEFDQRVRTVHPHMLHRLEVAQSRSTRSFVLVLFHTPTDSLIPILSMGTDRLGVDLDRQSARRDSVAQILSRTTLVVVFGCPLRGAMGSLAWFFALSRNAYIALDALITAVTRTVKASVECDRSKGEQTLWLSSTPYEEFGSSCATRGSE